MNSSFFCIYFKCFFLYLFHSFFLMCVCCFLLLLFVVVKVLFGNPSLAVLPLFIALLMVIHQPPVTTGAANQGRRESLGAEVEHLKTYFSSLRSHICTSHS